MGRFSLRPIGGAVALTLLLASCGGNTPPTTTTTTTLPPTTTTTAPPVTTTTTVPETTTTTLPPSPVLAREGDKNEIVAAFQFLLECGGYADLTPDGSFGPATTTAVQAAQTALGFPSSGNATEELFAALSSTCAEDPPITMGEDAALVVGYTTAADPASLPISLLFGSTLTVGVITGDGLTITVKSEDGTEVESEDGTTFPITETGDYTIEVTTEADPVVFTLEVGAAPGEGSGDWIITTDGIAYKDTKFPLGTAAGPMITKIIAALGHNVRSQYDEFDTGWDDPAQPGFRGIMIEGIAFLFYGPTPSDPTRPEVFGRVRYVGPSFDKDGNPRPAGYVQTKSGITVGNSLADLIETYGTGVKPGSNSKEKYYRYGSADGKEVCFYFGKDTPTDSSKILEISTECRG